MYFSRWLVHHEDFSHQDPCEWLLPQDDSHIISVSQNFKLKDSTGFYVYTHIGVIVYDHILHLRST